ncbi:hypothetical protein JCM5353_008142 [Sporobolomyces roseus]
MATYDNGLYTPWTPVDQGQPAPTTQAVEYHNTMVDLSFHSSLVTSSTISSSSSSTRSTSSLTPSVSSSSSTLRPSGIVAASSSETSSSPPFKITYLLPVFIIVPCVLLFLLAAWTYGKYWAKPRTDGSSSGRPQDQPGFWDGAYKSIGTKSRKTLPEDEDEKDGLVIGKDWSNGNEDIESATPKRKQSSKWSNWLPLGRGNSTSSNQSYNHVPFVSVSYASLDQPFVPPSNSNAAIARSTSQMSHSNKDRGWTWGTKPQATTSALRVMNGDERDEDSEHLTIGGGWGVGSTSRKYRAKSARSKNGSISSRISDRIKNSLSPGGFGPNDTAPSPSVYSPQFSPQGQQQAYAELDEEDDDDDSFMDEKKVDLDAYLGQSRVGHGGIANRYLNGDPTAVPPPRRASGRQLHPGAGMQEEHHIKNDYYARQQGGGGGNMPRSSTTDSFGPPRRQAPPVAPIFPVNLPSAPPRSQVSPKKSQSTLLRAPPSSEPRATPPPQLLFGYDSPPPPAPRGPLPIPSSQSRSQLANDPFTSPPARVPFRSQAAPQLSRPPRSNGTSTPFSPETAPALFFASPPLASPPSSQGHHQYSNVVGSPMPDFQPGALRASESAFSLQGVDALIFTDPSRSESRTGLKELVQKPKSRKEEIDQLRRSVGPSASSIPAPHSHQNPSPLRNDPIVSGFKKITTRPMNDKRESLGFDPQFSESPSLAPLQHPSKVRAAIENLESKHSKHSSIDSTRSGRSQQSSSKPERMPSPPSPQKLERSTTTLGRSRRHGGFDSDPEHSQGEEEEDEDLIKHRRVSTLLLSRSRTQSGPPSGGGGGAVSTSSHEGSTEDDHVAVRPPLSSDSKRLSMMLRRKSTGPFPPMADEIEDSGEDMLKAMTRRSGIFD